MIAFIRLAGCDVDLDNDATFVIDYTMLLVGGLKTSVWGRNKVCSKSCAKLERTLNITRRGGFFWQVARA